MSSMLYPGFLCLFVVLSGCGSGSGIGTTFEAGNNLSWSYTPSDSLGLDGYNCSYSCDGPQCEGTVGCAVAGNTLQLLPFAANNTQKQGMAVRFMRQEPLHLWDPESGSAASLHSFFVLRLRNVSHRARGHGMAFLLASDLQVPDRSTGSGMGLLRNMSYNTGAPSQGKDCRIAALLFHTYLNSGDNSHKPYVAVVVNNVKPTEKRDMYSELDRFWDGKFAVWLDYDPATLVVEVRMLSIADTVSSYAGLSGILKPRADRLIKTTVNLTDRVNSYSYVGFSASTGSAVEINELFYWELSTTGIASRPKIGPGPEPEAGPGAGAGRNRIVMVAVPAGILVVALFAALLGWILYRKCGRSICLSIHAHRGLVSKTKISNGAPRLFCYGELQRATGNFSQDSLLGEGGFGKVYKGVLKDGDLVAVKRIADKSKQGEREFLSEVTIIGRLRHRNLVPLRGWCQNLMGKSELLLVYDYMPNGSLDQHVLPSLHGEKEEGGIDRPVMNWNDRFHILRGVAAALLYLHDDWMEIGQGQSVVHRDIKSSNVMLDGDWNARLGDFGLARLVDRNKSGAVSSVAGTMGYLAPEATYTRKLTVQADVYSFGVVALEVAAGRRPVEWSRPQNERFLVEWVRSLHKSNQLEDAADPRLQGLYNREELLLILKLGILCTQGEPSLRPSIREVVKHIAVGQSRLIEIPDTGSPFFPHFCCSSGSSSTTSSSVSAQSLT